MDDAPDSGGRRPRSLKGGNRGPGSLGGAARTMGILALAVVYRLVRLAEIGQHEAIVDGDGVRRQGYARSLRSSVCWNERQERAPMRLWAEPLAHRPRSGGKGERQSGVVLDIAAS